MNALVPAMVAETALSRLLQSVLLLMHMGKVRDTYFLPGFPDKLGVVVTDRISIYDRVLKRLVPMKGEVLVALTVFWLTKIFADVPNHLVAYGAGIDEYLPESLRGNPELQRRMIIVEKLDMLPIECIVRGYLTGTGYTAYTETGKVCGIQLQPGLFDGSKLSTPIFTPTNKAAPGKHDVHLNAKAIERKYGSRVREFALELYNRGQAHADLCETILADTKFEFGLRNGRLILGDEVLTPDSSRFWHVMAYAAAIARRQAPQGWDKQPTRDAGKKSGMMDNLSDWEVPDEVIAETQDRYLAIAERLTGYSLPVFQAVVMGIN